MDKQKTKTEFDMIAMFWCGAMFGACLMLFVFAVGLR